MFPAKAPNTRSGNKLKFWIKNHRPDFQGNYSSPTPITQSMTPEEGRLPTVPVECRASAWIVLVILEFPILWLRYMLQELILLRKRLIYIHNPMYKHSLCNSISS